MRPEAPSARAETFDRAEEQLERGDFAAAEEAYRSFLLLDLTAGADMGLPQLVALERIGDIAVLFGEWDRAERLLAAVRDAFAHAGNLYASDCISLKLASLAISRGWSGVARQTLASLSGAPSSAPPADGRSLARWESGWSWPGMQDGDHAVFFARYYLEAGRMMAACGQYEWAAAFLKRGLDHSQADTNSGQAELPLVLSLAAAYLERGDLPSAAAALSLLRAEPDVARQPGFAIEELEISAKIDLLRGDLGPGKRKLERVIEICRERGFAQAQTMASLNLAYVLIFLNQTREAAELCHAARRTALARQDAVGVARAELLIRFAADRGQSLVSDVAIAPSVIEMQDMADPAEHRPASAAAQPFELAAAPNYLAFFEERTLGFYWHLGRCDWVAARRYLNEIEQVFLDTDSLLIRVRLTALDCMLAYYEGQFAVARRGLAAAIDVTQRMGLKPEHWQLLRFLEWSCIRMGDATAAAEVLAEAGELSRSMADTLAGADRALYLLNKWTDAERAFAAEIEELVSLKRTILSPRWRDRLRRPWRRIELAARLAALLERADRYKGDIMRRDEEKNVGDSGPLRRSLGRLLRLMRHPRDRATISFLVLPDRVLVARTGWMSLDFGLTGVTRIQLRELVRQYHEAMRDRRRSADVIATLGKALQLPAVLASLPRRIRALTFVPDDVLHGVPFAALPTSGRSKSPAPHPERYLIEDFTVSMDYEWLPRPRPPAQKGEALVIAITQGADGIAPLPEAEKERIRVLQWLASCSVAATAVKTPAKEEILRRLPSAWFFHIACHGEFRPDSPAESGLILVSPQGEVDLLSLRELSRLDLTRMEQAVLSSCWSADNFVLPGRWVISLPETLWRAGARSVLGSLWELNDELAVSLADRFYRALAAGLPRDEALRQAQVACLHESFQGPAEWAGLMLYGDTRKVRFAKSR